jgi:hypothetical protein
MKVTVVKGVQLTTPLTSSRAIIPMRMSILCVQTSTKTQLHERLLVRGQKAKATTCCHNVNMDQPTKILAMANRGSDQPIPTPLQTQGQLSKIDSARVKTANHILPLPISMNMQTELVHT